MGGTQRRKSNKWEDTLVCQTNNVITKVEEIEEEEDAEPEEAWKKEDTEQIKGHNNHAQRAAECKVCYIKTDNMNQTTNARHSMQIKLNAHIQQSTSK